MNRLQTKGLKVMGVISAHASLRNHHAKAQKNFVVDRHRTDERLCARLSPKGCATRLRQIATAVNLTFKGLKKITKKTLFAAHAHYFGEGESGIAPFPRLSGRNARAGRTKTERPSITQVAGPEIQGHNICITIMPMKRTWK